jgi:hypothetical protein
MRPVEWQRAAVSMNQPSPGAHRRATPQRALAAIAVVIILALVGIGVYTWQSLGHVAMDANGYLALVLGVLGTVGLGGGLMALVFFSHRYGYDDKVGGGSGKSRDEP